ncbi:MAG: cold shock domain-containing protein [Rhodomicrobium sp.]
MKRGTVKFYLPDRNYGFVQPSITGEIDVYFAKSAVASTAIESLRPGTQVLYELASDVRALRPAARRIQLAEPDA